MARRDKAKREKPVGKYDPDTHPDRAYKLCLLGLTNAELATQFDVDESTIERWYGKYPEFREEVDNGREIADAEVASALYHRAKGYKHRAVKIMQYEGEPVVVPYTEHYPPDTAAANLWLTNRQPKKWKNKQSNEHSGPNGAPLEIAVVRRVIVDPKT